MEELMGRILLSLNSANSSMLSSLYTQLPMELPDGKGRSVTSLQEQILSKAASNLMKLWVSHTN